MTMSVRSSIEKTDKTSSACSNNKIDQFIALKRGISSLVLFLFLQKVCFAYTYFKHLNSKYLT